MEIEKNGNSSASVHNISDLFHHFIFAYPFRSIYKMELWKIAEIFRYNRCYCDIFIAFLYINHKDNDRYQRVRSENIWENECIHIMG